MKIDIYDSNGKKKGTQDLPEEIFCAPINEGLMHLALLRQQSNRRIAVAHVKSRGEIKCSTAKLYRQKGTGRARRGSASANILRGGAKAFGPRNIRNFTKDMPRKMRKSSLKSCLSYSAKNGRIFGLEGYNGESKTKSFVELLSKLPVDMGRKTIFVLSEKIENLEIASRNVSGVRTIKAEYLNPEDVLGAWNLVFVGDSIDKTTNMLKSSDSDEKSQKIDASASSASSVSSKSSK
jgi:large subunit ribosomal protein L4